MPPPPGYGGTGFTATSVRAESVLRWAYVNALTAKLAVQQLGARVGARLDSLGVSVDERMKTLEARPAPASALWLKHGRSSAGLVKVPPNRATEVKPERDGITVPAPGAAILAVKLNFVDLPPASSGQRPSSVSVWFRRPSEGQPLNATGTHDYAVPQNEQPGFKVTHTYLTFVESAGDVVRAVVMHDGATTITADLAQFVVLVPNPEV